MTFEESLLSSTGPCEFENFVEKIFNFRLLKKTGEICRAKEERNMLMQGFVNNGEREKMFNERAKKVEFFILSLLSTPK